MKPRRPKLVQHIPTRPQAMFEVVEHTPGDTYWEFRIRDAIVGDEPIFRYTPPKKGNPFTVQQLANAGAGCLNEARGMVTIQEVIDGIPTFAAIFVSDGRFVSCILSTDESRAKPVDFRAAHEWLAKRQRAALEAT